MLRVRLDLFAHYDAAISELSTQIEVVVEPFQASGI